jgi:hypothetical protein
MARVYRRYRRRRMICPYYYLYHNKGICRCIQDNCNCFGNEENCENLLAKESYIQDEEER